MSRRTARRASGRRDIGPAQQQIDHLRISNSSRALCTVRDKASSFCHFFQRNWTRHREFHPGAARARRDKKAKHGTQERGRTALGPGVSPRSKGNPERVFEEFESGMTRFGEASRTSKSDICLWTTPVLQRTRDQAYQEHSEETHESPVKFAQVSTFSFFG